jgi:glycerol-3-phosphate O-acyltransferase / dihydroxyacetone phosphate acyltransferase
MWLLPLLHRLGRVPVHAYYRLAVSGKRGPRSGPLLLVANHPNSLFDPLLVAMAAGRPVRFLAKEPLFHDPVVGWLVRGAGSIPVFRAQDDPGSVGRNEEAFRAAHEALRDGAALGIFPEGISHHLPALAPLKTGAARIALGAAALRGGAFPILPVGLSFRDKERFRSEGLVRVGAPVEWDDLASPDFGAREVRELTRRIGEALRAHTLNLGSWEDAPLVRWAAAVYAAEFGVPVDAAARVAAEQEAVAILSAERERGSDEWSEAARLLRRHARILGHLGLEPSDLHESPTLATTLRWTLRQAAMLVGAGIFAALGSLLFLPPQRLGDLVVARMEVTPDVRSTYRTITTGVLGIAWIVILAATAAVLGGWVAGAVTLAALPALATLTLLVRDRWSSARGTARRYLLLRTRAALRQELLARQREIAARLRDLRERPPAPAAPTP